MTTTTQSAGDIFAVVWVDCLAGQLSLTKASGAEAIESALSIMRRGVAKVASVRAVYLAADSDSFVDLLQMPTKADGTPHTDSDYRKQGMGAALAGVSIDNCPYYASSTAEKHWKAGFRSAAKVAA